MKKSIKFTKFAFFIAVFAMSAFCEQPLDCKPFEVDACYRNNRNITKKSEKNSAENYFWELQLINAKNPIKKSPQYLSFIGSFNGQARVFGSRAAEYAVSMISSAKKDGIALPLVSSYRSIERQTANFETFFENAVSKGLSPLEAFDYAASEIAVPNTSEHNAGLAIDFDSGNDNSFDQTKAFDWLQENAHKYGFILRYPKGAEAITGIVYEPWHYRFVGVYHAENIREQGLVLEQYIEKYIGCPEEDNSVYEEFKARFVSY